jgi:hypothetical protein
VISELYKRLKEIADREFNEIIEDSEIITSYTGRARKLRLKLIDDTFIDIWYSQDGEYSFHWEQSQVRNIIYRHDNAPHQKWSYVKTFPKHCHENSQENVIESGLPDKPDEALRAFLSIVKKRIIEFKQKKKE